MPVYENSDKLYEALRLLFERISSHKDTAQAVRSSGLAIRFTLTAPHGQVLVNGRMSPVAVHYGPSSVRPDLEVELTADALHAILLGDLRLRKAIGSGAMKVRGPIWKTFALEEILHQGQALYPDVVREIGL